MHATQRGTQLGQACRAPLRAFLSLATERGLPARASCKSGAQGAQAVPWGGGGGRANGQGRPCSCKGTQKVLWSKNLNTGLPKEPRSTQRPPKGSPSRLAGGLGDLRPIQAPPRAEQGGNKTFPSPCSTFHKCRHNPAMLSKRSRCPFKAQNFLQPRGRHVTVRLAQIPGQAVPSSGHRWILHKGHNFCGHVL